MRGGTRQSLAARKLALERVSTALKDIEAKIKQAGRRLTRDLIAEGTGMARSAVSGWFAGTQLPRRKQLEALADVFSAGDDLLKMKYRRELFEAAGVPIDLRGGRDPMSRARERSSEIIFGVVAYDDVGVDRFFTNVVTAFGDFCEFPLKVQPVPFQNLSDDIASGKVDIGAGFWETPERLLTLRFIGTPITIGMNMITFAQAKRAIPNREDAWDVNAIGPIMNEGQASYRFAQHVFGIGKHKITASDYNESLFASKLRENFAQWLADRSKPVPVIITDELMCLKIHSLLLSEIVGSSPSPGIFEGAGPPLLLIGKRKKWARGNEMIASHPRYNISLCVKRIPNDDWYPYIEDAWRIFLRGNTEFLTQEYAKLRDRLKGLTDTLGSMYRQVQDVGIIWHPQDHEGSVEEIMVGEWETMRHEWLFNNSLHDIHYRNTWNDIQDLLKGGDLDSNGKTLDVAAPRCLRESLSEVK